MKKLKIIFIILIMATFSCSVDDDSEPQNPELCSNFIAFKVISKNIKKVS